MQRRRVRKERVKRQPSVEENISTRASDGDNPHVTFDVEEARRELRRLAEVKDE